MYRPKYECGAGLLLLRLCKELLAAVHPHQQQALELRLSWREQKMVGIGKLARKSRKRLWFPGANRAERRAESLML